MADSSPSPESSTDQDPVVKVSLNTVYAEVLRQNEAYARIEGKVDRLVDKVMDVVIPQMSDHETRIRALESHPSQGVTPAELEKVWSAVNLVQSQMLTKKGMYTALGLLCTIIMCVNGFAYWIH